MRRSRKIILGAALALLAALAIGSRSAPQAGPAAPVPAAAQTLARADLAETIFAMVLENAANAGMALSQPPTLCQACVAAHLERAAEVVGSRCERACGLR